MPDTLGRTIDTKKVEAQVGTRAKITIVATVCVPLALSGCKTMESAFDNDCKVGGAAIGAVIGGVAGGLLFGKAAGKAGTALLGAAVGGLIGQQIGSLLDCQDKQALAAASQTAGDAPVGQKVVWASDTAKVPADAATPPTPTAEPQPTTSTPSTANATTRVTQPPKPKAQPQGPVKAIPLPPPSNASPAAPQQDSQWLAIEPVRSSGQSGNWGWVEPITAPAKAADGRTCRTLKQVVIDASGGQHEEMVTSCLNDQQQWVVASR